MVEIVRAPDSPDTVSKYFNVRLTDGSNYYTSDDNTNLVTVLDYNVNNILIYQGRAVAGSSKASAVWQIKKFISYIS